MTFINKCCVEYCMQLSGNGEIIEENKIHMFPTVETGHRYMVINFTILSLCV